MGVYNYIPEFSEGFIGDVAIVPATNVDGDLPRWNNTIRKWQTVNQTSITLPTHNHDDLYFRETEHLDSSDGESDFGKPIKLDSDGRLPQSMRHLWDQQVKTANYVMSVNDEVIDADASLGPITITLPPVFEAKDLVYHIKRINGNENVVTVVATN